MDIYHKDKLTHACGLNWQIWYSHIYLHNFRSYAVFKRAGNLSRYVTSHPGQLSLAIPLWVGTVSTSLGWEGNHRSGIALSMHWTLVVYPPTGSMAYDREISTPPTLLWSICRVLFLSDCKYSLNPLNQTRID